MGLPLCGFTSSLKSPFHFGGVPPPPITHRTLPLFPQQTKAVGGGLPALATPAVSAASARWVKQIDKMTAAPGANKPLLARVRSMIVDGIRSTFKADAPPQEKHDNTSMFQKHEGECVDRMAAYEAMGAARRVPGTPPARAHIQPLHTVIKPGKKARVVFDLARNFNDFLTDESLHMSSIQDAVELSMQAGPSSWFVKLDISACFLSFPIHPDDQHLFYCQAGGNFYQFLALVFGRKDASLIATLLLDVVSAAMTDAGLLHIRYLDDFLLVATSKQRAWACAYTAATMLMEFGLAMSLPKFEGPLQRIEFLGIVTDSIKETLEISEERKQELLGLLNAMGKRQQASVQRIQSLIGKLSFAASVLPGAKPFLRRLIDTIRGLTHGNVSLHAGFKADCRFWKIHINQWNGTARWRAPTSTPFVFASDASTSGFAYGLESCAPEALSRLPAGMRPGDVRAGTWSMSNGDAARQATSSTIQWGEFFCPLAAVVEFGALLTNSHVVFVVDNESDVHVINRLRSREPRVAALLRCLCNTALLFNFSFEAVHRAGVHNVLMDWTSSRCLIFNDEDSSATWGLASDGW